MKLLGSFLLCATTLLGQTITDASVKCPLVVSGSPSNVVASNNGSKQIIAYSMEFISTSGAVPPNRLHFTHDYYFQPYNIEAGTVTTLHSLPPEDIDPKESFTVITKYLQFSDGTEWGDASDWPDRVEVRNDVRNFVTRALQSGSLDALKTFLTGVIQDRSAPSVAKVVSAHLLRMDMADAQSELQVRAIMATAHASITK